MTPSVKFFPKIFHSIENVRNKLLARNKITFSFPKHTFPFPKCTFKSYFHVDFTIHRHFLYVSIEMNIFQATSV